MKNRYTNAWLIAVGLLAACQPSATTPQAKPPIASSPVKADEAVVPMVTKQAAPTGLVGATLSFPAIASTTLKNGISLDLIERRSMPVVQLSLVVAAGHAKDADHPGAARVLAQWLEAGGAGKWSSEKLREAVDALGSSLDITSSRDNMRWSLAVTSDKVPDALAILAALVQKPRFDGKEFTKLRDRELERVRSLAKTSGSWLAQYWLHRELYRKPMGVHAYASVDALPSELQRLNPEDCRAFYKTHVVPTNARLLVVGAVDVASLTQQAEAAFGGWVGGNAPDEGIVEPTAPERLQIFVVDRPGSSQSDILLGVLGPSRRSPDFSSILAIQQILGGGVAGRLFLDVREKRSLAYATYAGIQEVAFGPSVLTLSAGTQTAKTSEAVGALLEHLERVNEDPGSSSELEIARSYIVRGMPARWESVESLAHQLLLLRTHGQSDRYFDELREQIGSLDVAQLKAPAARYYKPKQATLVVAGDADAIADSLRRFGPVEILNPEKEFSIKKKLPAQP